MIKNILYRIWHLAETSAIKLKPIKPKSLIEGKNCVNQIGEVLKNKKIDSTLIVTTRGMITRGTINVLLNSLKDNGIKYEIYDNVKPDPSITLVEEAVTLYNENSLNSIIAFGGGSCIDLAKICGARISRPTKSVKQLCGVIKIRKKLPYFIAVPTTYGTGSEVTAAAVITDDTVTPVKKITIMDYCLVPDVAILDPMVTLDLPSKITAYTAMDAFTHAIESYTNKFSSKKTQKYSLKAMKLIKDNVIDVYSSDCSNDELILKKEKLLKASYLAGISFTNGFVGYVHSIAHAIGALYHLPHGLCCAVLLPNVMLSSYFNVEKKMKEIAKYLNIENSDNTSLNSVVNYINKLNKKLGIENKLVQIDKKDYDIITNRALKEANPNYPVPRILFKKDIIEILQNLVKML